MRRCIGKSSPRKMVRNSESDSQERGVIADDEEKRKELKIRKKVI